MNHDIDIKKVRINCFRQSKVAGEFMLQMRVPGAMIEAKHLKLVQDLCERFRKRHLPSGHQADL